MLCPLSRQEISYIRCRMSCFEYSAALCLFASSFLTKKASYFPPKQAWGKTPQRRGFTGGFRLPVFVKTSRLTSGGAVFDFHQCRNRCPAASRLVQRPAGRPYRNLPAGNGRTTMCDGTAPAKPVWTELPDNAKGIRGTAKRRLRLHTRQTVPRKRCRPCQTAGNSGNYGLLLAMRR